MARRTIRCILDIDIHKVTAPGVWLPSREDCYVSISLFGQRKNTRNVASVFPVLVHEPFTFEKNYYHTAGCSVDVAALLKDEIVTIELLQFSEFTYGSKCLASYSSRASDFFFPYHSSLTYSSSLRDVYFSTNIGFPGLAPKLEFYTKADVIEIVTPAREVLADALEEEKMLRRARSRSRSVSRSRQRSRSASLTRSRSRSRSRSCTRPLSDCRAAHCWKCSDPRYMKQTISSLSRSRSCLSDTEYTRQARRNSLIRSTNLLSDIDDEVAGYTSSPCYVPATPRPRSACYVPATPRPRSASLTRSYNYPTAYTTGYDIGTLSAEESLDLAIARSDARLRALSPLPRRSYTPTQVLCRSVTDLTLDPLPRRTYVTPTYTTYPYTSYYL